MKIGILKEEKKPEDKRVPLSPVQCRKLLDAYSEIELVVKSSNTRCFSDSMYKVEGVEVVNDLQDCDLLLGIKEVPIEELIPNKTYLYFSHTIKKQKYNQKLLRKMIDMNIQMIDYEALKDNNKRLLGFGKYAGIIGAYNAFLAYGIKSGKYYLKAAHDCINKIEMEDQMSNIILSNEKIIITGNGRVGKGALETMKKTNIIEVSKDQFINNSFDSPVFVHLNTMDYNMRKDNLESDKNEFYSNPELYKSSFMDYAKYADIFIAGHYHSFGSPYLFTREDAKTIDFNLKVIADISCDIDGPVASTIRSSTINEPIYGYNPNTEQEDDFNKEGVVAVMAINNLPCELPKDSSKYFGNELLDKVLPLLIKNKDNDIIANGTICKNGDLTPKFEYLRDYLNRF